LADGVSISFLFTRFFCEHIFQTDIPRERPAPPEQLLDLTALAKMEFTKSPHINPGMAPPLLFAVFLSGVDDLDWADPTLSIFREVYRQVPINALRHIVLPVSFSPPSSPSFDGELPELLSLLARLDITRIPSDVVMTIATFWASHTASIVDRVRREFVFDSASLAGVFGLARNAVLLSSAIQNDFPIAAFLEGKPPEAVVATAPVYPCRATSPDIGPAVARLQLAFRFCPDCDFYRG
jgi:hypothetical protein